MWWRKKKKVEKYRPTGRIGYYRKHDYPYYYRIIVEKIQEVNISSKVRILEVDINRGCNKSKEQCLADAILGDWVRTEGILWETDEQYNDRLGNVETNIFTTPPVELSNDDVDYTPHPSNPFRHNFLQQR